MTLVILVPLELAMCWMNAPLSLQEMWGQAAQGVRALFPALPPQRIAAWSPQSSQPIFQPPAASAEQTILESTPFKPTLVSATNFPAPPAQLSPDGRFAAGLVLDQGTSSWGSLIVYRVSDRTEIKRHRVATEAMKHLWWLNDEGWLMGWQKYSVGRIRVGNGAQTTDMNMVPTYDGQETSYDPANDLAVQFDHGGDLKASRISDRQNVPLAYDWRPTGGFSALALVPTPKGQTATSVQAILSERWGEPNPTPIPTPPPTPQPLTHEQRKFQIKDDIQAEELSALSERFQTAQNLSPSEEKKLFARAKAINKFDVDGRARFFPPPSRAEKVMGPEDYSRVQRRDLSTGQLMWTRKISSTWLPPHPLFSSDGSALLLMGLPRLTELHVGRDAGVEVLDPQTGITKFRLKLGGEDFENSQTLRFFTSGHPMVAYTRNADRDTFLYIADLTNGRQVSKWPLSELKSLGISSLNGFSCDAAGNTWSFSVDTGEGWKVFTRARLEAPGKTL